MTTLRAFLNSATFRVDAVGATIAVAITVIAAGSLLWPMIASAEDGPRRDAVADLENRARAEEAALRIERAELEALQKQLDAAVTLEPASKVNTRLVGLAALADRCGVSITLLTHQTARAQKKAVVVPIKIGGSGSYLEVTRFARALHDEYRDTAVVGLSINGAPSAAPNDATYTLDLAWYAAPAGPAGGGAKRTPAAP